jgi:ABC-type transporter MlaC component
MDPKRGDGGTQVSGGSKEDTHSNGALNEEETARYLSNGGEHGPAAGIPKAFTVVGYVVEEPESASNQNETSVMAGASSGRPEDVNSVALGVRDSTLTNATTGGNAERSRSSSLELRKLPVNVLLKREESLLCDEELSLDDAPMDGSPRSLLQRTCLNSNFTLRSQMLLSFGTISALAILLVVIVCIAVTLISSSVVKAGARATFDDLSPVLEAKATRYIAEDLTPRLIFEDVVQILTEAIQDRFNGYPDFLDDSKVPFFDTLSGKNKYPLVGELLPLDFQIDANVNEQNKDEHVQERFPWFKGGKVSTVNAAYYMQGVCDPAVTDPAEPTYFENCTDANNDIATGGIYAPTPTNIHVHRKISDLTPLLKSLFEYHTDFLTLTYYFTNGGSGSSVSYPGVQMRNGGNYSSIGCEWLKGPNPFDESKPILTPEEVARCEKTGSIMRVEGAAIPTRLYSPLDRGWFRDFVRNKGKLTVSGPFPEAWTGGWVLLVGRAVHDPLTKALVGAMTIALRVDASLPDILLSSRMTNNSHVSVAVFDEMGTVTVSTAWNITSANFTVSISELDVGVTQNSYADFYSLVDYSTVWDANSTKQAYENFFVQESAYRVRAYPMPPVPDEYDASYRPMFLVFFSLSKADFFESVNAAEDQVDKQVKSLIILSIFVGAVGLGVIMIILLAVSNRITQPLRKMDQAAMKIIEGFAGNEEKIEMDFDASRFIVQTELSQIVKEFQRMVQKFSGGAMAKSAKVTITEINNNFQQVKEFEELYLSRRDAGFAYKVEDARVSTEENVGSATVQRVHLGSNVISGGASTVLLSVKPEWESSNSKWVSSPLFKWIVGLIVIPLLLSTVTISTIVTVRISQALPGMIIFAEQGLIDLQVAALSAFATLRAGFVAESTAQPIRDAYVLTRYASWLLFGALKIEGFPGMITGGEECKQHPNVTSCPFLSANQVCDCTWTLEIQPPPLPCEELGPGARMLQQNYWAGSSQDVRPNGDRNSNSFPTLAYSQNTTAWWLSPDIVPGSPETPINGAVGWANATPTTQRYATPYGRLRSVAASPMMIPLFNYDVRRETIMGNMIAFEADGMYTGYMGCQTATYASRSSFFVSSEQNRAGVVRPELCPIGE